MQFQGETAVNSKVYVEKHLHLISVVRYFPGVDVDNFSQNNKEHKRNFVKKNEETRRNVLELQSFFLLKALCV